MHRLISFPSRPRPCFKKLTVEAETKFKLGNGSHLLLGQREVEHVNVGLGALNVHALGDDSDTTIDGPAQKNLGSALTVLGSDILDDVVTEQWLSGLTIIGQLDERSGTEGRVGSDLDTLLLNPLNKAGLLEVGVQFNCNHNK